MLIAFEGPDGSGKKTQAEELLNFLRSRQIKTAFFDFPRYSTRTGEPVGNMLHGKFGKFARLNPYLTGTMFAVDRLATLSEIEKAQASGGIIVFNRWMYSNVHQAARLKTAKEQMDCLNYFLWLETVVMGLPKADKVIFCDVSPQRAMENAKERARASGKGQDKVEADKEYIKRGINLYRRVAKKNPDWIWVDCMRTNIEMREKAEIQDEILESLRRHKILPE